MRARTKAHHIEPKTVISGAMSLDEFFQQTDDGRPMSAVSLAGLRYREDYTQKELGDMIGVDQANVSKMERGLRPIGKNMAKKLAKVFKVDYRIFL